MWTFNIPNDDLWCSGEYDTPAEAIENAIKYAERFGLDEMVIGETEPVPLPEHIDASDIIEMLEEAYADEAGPEYDRELYEDVEEEDMEWLENEIQKVIRLFNERARITSNWNTINNIHHIHINNSGKET